MSQLIFTDFSATSLALTVAGVFVADFTPGGGTAPSYTGSIPDQSFPNNTQPPQSITTLDVSDQFSDVAEGAVWTMEVVAVAPANSTNRITVTQAGVLQIETWPLPMGNWDCTISVANPGTIAATSDVFRITITPELATPGAPNNEPLIYDGMIPTLTPAMLAGSGYDLSQHFIGSGPITYTLGSALGTVAVNASTGAVTGTFSGSGNRNITFDNNSEYDHVVSVSFAQS